MSDWEFHKFFSNSYSNSLKSLILISSFYLEISIKRIFIINKLEGLIKWIFWSIDVFIVRKEVVEVVDKIVLKGRKDSTVLTNIFSLISSFFICATLISQLAKNLRLFWLKIWDFLLYH